MKSAYELAMERLAKSEPAKTLTAGQKARLAEIDTVHRAKLAERQTFLQGLLAQAEIKGDAQEADDLQFQLKRDTAAIREEWEAKKDQVWRE